MRLITHLLILFLPSVVFAAEPRPIEVALPPGWSEVSLTPQESRNAGPFLTLKFQYRAAHTGEIMITLIGDTHGKMSDRAGLEQMHRMQAQQWQTSPDEKIDVKTLPIRAGIAIYSVHEDASLIGKPLPPDEWRVATPVAILLGSSTLIHSTIFTNETSGAVLDGALQLVGSVHLNSAASPAASEVPQVPVISVVVEGLDQQLLLPREGMQKMSTLQSDDPSYFCLMSGEGVTISGWLLPKSKQTDFRTTWTKETAAMRKDTGAVIADEQWKIIAGWQVVTYTVTLKQLAQCNLRASRVVGNTWLDVHLSSMDRENGPKAMDALLRRLALVPVKSG